MEGYSHEYQWFSDEGVDAITSTGDILVFTPARPIAVVDFGLVVTTTFNASAGAVTLKLDKRVTAGSDTGRGDGDLGTLTMTAAQAQALAAGDVARSVKAEGSGAYAGPAATEAADVVLPGEQAVVEVTDAAATAGSGIPFIGFKDLPRGRRATGVELVVTS